MICIIPARGGSKRIKHKNIVDFCGKPLIARSIESAVNSGIFSQVVVSSDDENIIKVANEYGAITPFVRDASLSDDFATSSAVMKDAILRLEKDFTFTNVCCLYATAPLINDEILKNAANEFLKDKEIKFLFAACEFEYPVQRGFKLLEQNRVCMFDESKYYKRSQDLESAYHDGGAFYFGSKKAWLECDFMFKPYSKAFVLDRTLLCDIDTPQDLELAKALFKAKYEC